MVTIKKGRKKKRKLEDSKLFRKSLCQVSSYSYTVSLDFAPFNLCPKQKERNLIDSDLY